MAVAGDWLDLDDLLDGSTALDRDAVRHEEPTIELAADEQSDACELGSSSEDNAAEECAPSCAENQRANWEVGVNCGKWFRSQSPLAQVMTANCAHNLATLPRSLLTRLAECVSKRYRGAKSITERVSAWLLGISSSSCSRVLQALNMNGGRVTECPGSQVAPQLPTHDKDLKRDCLEAAMLTVNVALVNAAEDRSYLEFERDACRLANRGCKLAFGHSRHVAREAEFLAAKVMQRMDALDFDTRLAGLDIPSNLNIIADPVSIGSTMYARNETVLFLAITTISPHTYRHHCPMIGGDTMPFGSHGKRRLKEMILDMMFEHPACFTLQRLKASCALVGGDGQFVRGGERHRHSSSQVAEALWEEIHGSGVWLDMECTEWDFMHRYDIGLERAVKRNNAASEVMDIASVLDKLFAIGEGRALYRSVAAHLGVKGTRLGVPGGTRKFVYLDLRVSSNYKLLHGALHSRIAWKGLGHGRLSLESLVDVARRFSDVTFVVFLAFFEEFMAVVVKPFSLIVQKAVEPNAIEKAHARLSSALTHSKQSLVRARAILTIAALLRQHAHATEIARFIAAMSYDKVLRPLWNCLPRINQILVSVPPVFDGCALNVLMTDQTAQLNFLGPHCQCLAKEQWVQRGGKLFDESGEPIGRAEVFLPRGSEQRKTGAFHLRANKNTQKHNFIKLRVPLWTVLRSSSRIGSDDVKDQYFHPRMQKRDKIGSRALGIDLTGFFRPRLLQDLSKDCGHQEKPNKWRKDGCCTCCWISRCQVPAEVYKIHAMVIEALDSAELLFNDIQNEVQDILGDVGMNSDMLSLKAHCRDCWDWDTLVLQQPERKHVDAFLQGYEMLAPFLRHTYWPQKKIFEKIVREVRLNNEVLAYQYVLLCRRVRAAAAAAVCPGSRHIPECNFVPEAVVAHAKSWAVLTLCAVVPVFEFPVVRQLVATLAGSDGQLCHTLASKITLFSGHLDRNEAVLPRQAYETFTAPRDNLTYFIAGSSRLQTKKRKLANGGPSLAVGHIAALCGRSQRGKLVVVVRMDSKIDSSAVSEALDRFPYFSVGASERAPSAYQAALFHHRYRLLFAPSAAVERLGSILHQQYDAVQGLAPAALVDRVLLSSAHVSCLGSERDELLVRAVASTMLEARARRRIIDGPVDLAQVTDKIENSSASGRMPGIPTGMDQDEVIALLDPLADESGLAGKDALRHLRAQHMNSSLPTSLPAELLKTLNGLSRDGVLQPLPISTVARRASAKGVANSVMNNLLEDWLQSSEGQAFRSARSEVWQREHDTV